MMPEPGAEPAEVLLALEAWRHRAADVLMAVTAALHAVPVTLAVVGFAPPMTPSARGLMLAAYIVMVASAVLRRIDYRARLWAAISAAYLVAAAANLASFSGPYALVGLVANPIFVLVLCGSKQALWASAASAAIFVTAPFVRLLPGVAMLALIDPSAAVAPDEVFWSRAIALCAFLALLMVLLERFHAFLLNALAAQFRAKVALNGEIERRIAAQRRIEDQARERQRLEHEIAAIGDEERRRLGQELHDGVCQELTAALLRCDALERCLRRGGAVTDTDIAPLSSMLAETIDDAHNIAQGICPLEPDPDALAPSLRALTRRMQEMANLRCEFVADGDVRVPDPARAQHLYRIAQEALSNAARHARAGRIEVALRGSDRELVLTVRDDGVGLAADARTSGMGLRTMAHRARILEGELTVTPADGGGTCVACRVPRAAGQPVASTLPGGDHALRP